MKELRADDILREVETMVSEDVSYIDALVEYSNRHGVEIEVIGDIVRRSQVAMARIREDAENLSLVEKTKRLPI